MRLIENDTRAVIGWMNYKRVSDVDPFMPMGPNYMGEWLWPVEKEKNRIGFSLMPPEEE